VVSAEIAAGIPALAGDASRTAEAETLMLAIEKEAATAGPLPPAQPASPIPPFSLSSLVGPCQKSTNGLISRKSSV
jgi:hypothetical protein